MTGGPQTFVVELCAVEDDRGLLVIPAMKPCRDCGLKPYDAPDLQPGEMVCTCNWPINEED